MVCKSSVPVVVIDSLYHLLGHAIGVELSWVGVRVMVGIGVMGVLLGNGRVCAESRSFT